MRGVLSFRFLTEAEALNCVGEDDRRGTLERNRSVVGRVDLRRIMAAAAKTLELVAYGPSGNEDIDHAEVQIYATEKGTGKKLQLLESYSLASAMPKDQLSMIFRFSDKAKRISLEIVEADDETGMSTLVSGGKRYKLNCDLE